MARRRAAPTSPILGRGGGGAVAAGGRRRQGHAGAQKDWRAGLPSTGALDAGAELAIVNTVNHASSLSQTERAICFTSARYNE